MGGSIVALELRVRVVSLLIVPNHVVLVHSRHVDGIDFFLAFLNQLLSSRIKCRLGVGEGRDARRKTRWQYPGHFHCFAAIFAFCGIFLTHLETHLCVFATNYLEFA